jgi:hypothetical protein
MKILFLILTSKEHNHQNNFNIDRVDLTRKLDVINTWVTDALYLGHEVIFFDGGNEIEYYDENSRTLHLNTPDGYESENTISPLYLKVKKATEWVYNNIDFDYTYICDDDVYVNLKEFLKIDFNYDFISNRFLGGGGFLYSRKGLKVLIDNEINDLGNCDTLIYKLMYSNSNIKKINNYSFCPFYIPGELYSTIHYVTGKRMYFVHNLIKNFQENSNTNRKIILNFPFNIMKKNIIVSYESKVNRISKRYYDYTTDPNGWEYHGNYQRSHITIESLKKFFPYAENSTKFFVINFNSLLSDYINFPNYEENFNFIINNCEKSLINKNNLLLCSDKEENIIGWELDNDAKEKYQLTFEELNNYYYYKKIK